MLVYRSVDCELDVHSGNFGGVRCRFGVSVVEGCTSMVQNSSSAFFVRFGAKETWAWNAFPPIGIVQKLRRRICGIVDASLRASLCGFPGKKKWLGIVAPITEPLHIQPTRGLGFAHLVRDWSVIHVIAQTCSSRSIWGFAESYPSSNVFFSLWLHLSPHVQESSQRCAAEIIAALVRGCKHWSYEKVNWANHPTSWVLVEVLPTTYVQSWSKVRGTPWEDALFLTSLLVQQWK